MKHLLAAVVLGIVIFVGFTSLGGRLEAWAHELPDPIPPARPAQKSTFREIDLKPFPTHDPQPDRTWHEPQWSQWLARLHNGHAEYRLPDGSRIDILQKNLPPGYFPSEHHIAWEVEWDDKWPEAVGQALFYGLSMDTGDTKTLPGIWLLKRSKTDENYHKCLLVVQKLRSRGIFMQFKVEIVK